VYGVVITNESEKKMVMQTAGHFWAWYSVCMCLRPWQWGCSCCVESSPPAASKCEARDGGWSGTQWKRRSLQSFYAYHSKQEKFPNQSIQHLIILNIVWVGSYSHMLGWCDMYTLCIDWTATHTLFCNRNVCIRVYRYIQYIQANMKNIHSIQPYIYTHTYNHVTIHTYI